MLSSAVFSILLVLSLKGHLSYFYNGPLVLMEMRYVYSVVVVVVVVVVVQHNIHSLFPSPVDVEPFGCL